MAGLNRSVQRTAVLHKHLRMASSAPEEEVILEKIGTKGLITLNRPKALNALNLGMIRKMYPTLRAWEGDPQTTMVIIRGSGDKAFCAGGDVVALAESAKAGTDFCKDFFKEEYILNNAIGTLHVPWIALIDGITMGGGVGLSVHGHYRVATERTLFAMPETAIALFPDVGGGYFLPRLGGKLGVYLALTGFRLKGRDVQKAGVATHFVDSALIPSLEKDLLGLKHAKTEDIHQVLKEYENRSQTEDKEFILSPHMDKINSLFGYNTMEEICHALKQDGSDWANKQLETLKQMSPSSMKVTLEQILRGAHMSLQDVLQMEYRISQHTMQEPDFVEGVRAVLVDKDKKPTWKPATLEDVSSDKVESYFAPLEASRELNF